ncbi:hypothetical protein [Devosia sp. MC521]|nr:hypothetical protein [Devosia sp. MC521]MBJ6987936.1 hypothetical protein [Devosia sp. MC521]QMW62016.1 hypothetical protein H4N61_13790 [Devosia sp. MC521]
MSFGTLVVVDATIDHKSIAGEVRTWLKPRYSVDRGSFRAIVDLAPTTE